MKRNVKCPECGYARKTTKNILNDICPTCNIIMETVTTAARYAPIGLQCLVGARERSKMDHVLPKDLDDLYGPGAEDSLSESSAADVIPTHCGLKIGEEVIVETTGAIGTVEALLPGGEVVVDLGLYSRVYSCLILNYPE